jgi:hypothetical protein
MSFVTCAALADVSASVDKSTIQMGDTLQLTINAGNIPNNAVPDLSSVVDNFDLLSSGQTQQVTMVNNKMVSETMWVFTLIPKHVGNLTIPAINVGSEQTQPVIVHVQNTPVASTNAADSNQAQQDVMVKAEMSPATPYVQSQATYILRLFYDKEIANPQLGEPTADGAEFIHLGQNRIYQKNINGHAYQVVELRYAMFPQKSGTLSIAGPTFIGQLASQDPDGWVSTSNVKPVHAAANAIETTIKAIPSNFGNHWWLPATHVQLTEQWATNPNQFTVGVPITRTIQLSAKGVLANQLPALMSTQVDGFQVYPDKPSTTSRTDGKDVFATRVEKAAYIPTQAGIVDLPAITVHWWNTDTNTAETATIPGQTINVLPAAGGTSNTPVTPAPATHVATSLAKTTATSKLQLMPIWLSNTIWFPVAIALAVLWVISIGLFFWWRKLQSRKLSVIEPDAAAIEQAESLKQTRSRVEQAVKAQDPQLFALALIKFARQFWADSTILSLADIAEHCQNEATRQAVLELDKLRYSHSSGVWQASQTWDIISREFVKTAVAKDKPLEQLPELYPDA